MEDKMVGGKERGGLEAEDITESIVVSGRRRGGMRDEPGEGGETDAATPLRAS